jgi:hypothetical protein
VDQELSAMDILISFLPFLVFFALMRLVTPVAGLTGAFLVSSLLTWRVRRRAESVKILEIGSLILFALLTLYTFVAAPRWTVATVRLAVDGGLLAIVVVSLGIGRPFTLQYARERVPAQFWTSPVFLTTNRIITAIWAGAFAVLVAADAAAEYVPAVPIWADVGASVGALLAAIWFTRWYPDWVRRAVVSGGPTADAPETP